jgi:heme/copper-type cytochrome/quinol oxidase subunit 2
VSEDLKQVGHAMRIGVIAFVAPIMVLATGFFLWEEMYLYAAAMTVFLFLTGLGVYMNWKRLASDEKIDDERMKEINRRSGFNSFWTVINASVLLMIFDGVIAGFLQVQRVFILKYDLSIVLALGFASYLGFRAYYLRYGLDSEFWRIG